MYSLTAKTGVDFQHRQTSPRLDLAAALPRNIIGLKK